MTTTAACSLVVFYLCLFLLGVSGIRRNRRRAARDAEVKRIHAVSDEVER